MLYWLDVISEFFKTHVHLVSMHQNKSRKDGKISVFRFHGSISCNFPLLVNPGRTIILSHTFIASRTFNTFTHYSQQMFIGTHLLRFLNSLEIFNFVFQLCGTNHLFTDVLKLSAIVSSFTFQAHLYVKAEKSHSHGETSFILTAIHYGIKNISCICHFLAAIILQFGSCKQFEKTHVLYPAACEWLFAKVLLYIQQWYFYCLLQL